MTFDWAYYWAGEGLLCAMPFGLLVVSIWGWLRWWKQDKKRSLIPIMSLVGFAFATASALLAISFIVYAKAIDGFVHYEPPWLRIEQCGTILSLSGIVLSFAGLWRPNALRWFAPLCSLGTMMYWFLVVSTEY
jgi:hypothetical protein